MFSKIRARFSSAHVMAGLAIFIVLGGSAFAIKANTVGSKQIKKNAVKTSKIANNAVKTAKIANDAVTGDKVNEASLGKVPSATTADTATSATSANTATTATSADNSTNLAGREFQQVRGLADGDSNGTANPLDGVAFEQVITEDIGIPTGGADVIANASIEVVNNVAGIRAAECELRSDAGDMSQTYTVSLPGSPNGSAVISLTGFANFPLGTGALTPEDIDVFCRGSAGAGDVSFVAGDIAVQRIPDGA